MNKFIVLSLLSATVVAPVSATVLKSNLQVGAGYVKAFGDGAEPSNQDQKAIFDVVYAAKTDWGSSRVRATLENPGRLNTTPKGFKVTSLKTESTTLIQLKQSSFSLWLDHQTNGNQKIADNHVRAGISYSTNLGPIKFRTSLAPEYYFGHSPKGDAYGLQMFNRTSFDYQWSKQFSQKFLFENTSLRNEQVQEAIGWKKHGYHYAIINNYKYNEKVSAKFIVHYFQSFAGFKFDAGSAVMLVRYKI
ncbi:hypothetical protein [Shewanella youngdeokensis]|uniref:Porin n=1 Tax=Shewanella youngdeokensis TaxID=2999068 RepID=A0ABZ0JVT0_9GAMM|nr:hypothetical protein RGE70_09505 [Shewanella sp. DAU334]